MAVFFNKEWLKPLFIALLLIGAMLVVIAIQQYVDASLRLQNNPIQQNQETGNAVTLQSQAAAPALMAAGLEFRRLTSQRNNALIIGGGGLILLALSWIGVDFIRARQR